MNDERLYAKVVEELSALGPIPGLWAKVFAECGGNEQAAKALYLRLRVEQLRSEEANAQRAKLAAERAAEAAEHALESEKRRVSARAEGHISTPLVVLAIILVALVGAYVGLAMRHQ
jgi:hypothetical protein